MKSVTFNSNAYNENITLYGDAFEPVNLNNAKGILLVVHGMAEHRKRYYDFANFLASNNYICALYDQRGHGETCGGVDKQGYMSNVDNFHAMVLDMNTVVNKLKELYPNKPITILGHSMGSFLTQRYIEMYGDTIDKAILSGTSYTVSGLYSAGRLLAKIIVKTHSREYKSKLLDKMSFGSYNKAFKPNRTSFDWLSRNEESVDKYIADPYCGALFTSSYFMDLLFGFKAIGKNFDKIPKDLPIYIFSGEKDPVGAQGKSTDKLNAKYKSLSLNVKSYKLYHNGRHEMLNELNKDEVYQDVLSYLND